MIDCAQDPWNLTEPFEPMFNETVSITCIRPQNKVTKTCLKVCSFPVEDTSPFSDSDVSSAIKQIKFIAIDGNTCSWNYSFKPQIGDSVTDTAGNEWKISEVTTSGKYIEMLCKSA